MNLNQYNCLTDEKRAFILDKAGVFVASTCNKYYEFRLFQINSFYVERVSKLDGTCCGIRAFRSISQLERYINQIDISPLIEYC